MKAVGYIRLSFKDQSRYSLDAQESSIREYCIKNGLELITLFKDNGQRSTTFDRLDFRALESFVRRHKGLIRYLIIMEHDRFSRDLSEALSKINKLERDYGIKVVSVDEPLDIDPSDPSTFINRAFRYATANTELLNIRSRTKRGIKRARLEGRFINKAPFGYRNGRDHSGKGILILQTEEAKIIRSIFKDYIAGLTFKQTTFNAQQIGFKLTGHNAIGRLLSSCLYAGLIKIKKNDEATKYIKALHKAIISEADFWLVQEMMGKNKPSKLKLSKDFPLKGLLKCHCGKYMTAGWSRGRKQYYLYYHCITHRALNVPDNIVHKQFEQILKSLELTSEQILYLKKELPARLEILLSEEKYQIDARQRMIQELDQKMNSLEEHFIEKHLDFETFSNWSTKYNVERQQIEQNIAELENYISILVQTVQLLLKELHSVYDICRQCGQIQRQMILKLVFRYGLSFEDGRLATYKICPTFGHNIFKLIENEQLKISLQDAVTHNNDEGYFLNFIAEQLIGQLVEHRNHKC